MALRMRKRPSISAIFERDEIRDRKYTKFAIRCQGILEYSIFLNENYPENKQSPPFTDWEVTGWLVENKKFYDDYKHLSKRKTTKANQIAANVGDVKETLDELVSLDLVENMGTERASRGNTITHKYRFTEFGYILAWIIKIFGNENRQKASNKIYSIFQSNYEVEPSSYDIFVSKLFKKFKDLGLFEDFVVKQLRKSLESNWNIGSMRQLLFISNIIDFDDVTNATSYNELREQTLNELEPDVKMLALHNLKLPLEKEMYMRSKNQSEYEKQRFEVRDKPDKVMLEGICHNCHFVIYVDVYIPYYLKRSHLYPNKFISNKCIQCNKDNCVVIPNVSDLVLYRI
jgi:hypothetical protein